MFHLKSNFSPSGDQPKAIADIVSSLQSGNEHHVLLGVTGSGKTFTMAQVIQKLGMSTLIIAPNKTLAAQLYSEFRAFFPDDPVGYFVSFYDYYQPEAYLPSSDTYIDKDSQRNDDIDKMRHAATRCLLEHSHCIVVASISCIYGLGSPETYKEQVLELEEGQRFARRDLLLALTEMQYRRNDEGLLRSTFRVRGEQIDLLPPDQRDEALRIVLSGDEISSLSLIDSLSGQLVKSVSEFSLFPPSHYSTKREQSQAVVQQILGDLSLRLRELKSLGKKEEASRLEERVMQDVENIEEWGYCHGIENYSRYLDQREAGEPPFCLLDYFPDKFLTIIDESHIALPQVRGMYFGDRSRKQVLVDFGFRLPSALDNRPLNFDEFMDKTPQILYVSATPGEAEIEYAGDCVSEQLIRPTGLLDPIVEVRPARNQVDDLYGEMRQVIDKGGRVLVNTLTKKMSEELFRHYQELGLEVRYLHADVDSLERVKLLRDLRKGVFQVLVGINLLREGLDLPEVALVAIFDADHEGFLRSRNSLVQLIGRAARHLEGRVLMYAERVTGSMDRAIKETKRRREIQIAYNKKRNVEPKGILKPIPEDLWKMHGFYTPKGRGAKAAVSDKEVEGFLELDVKEREALLDKYRRKMQDLSGLLKFEEAAALRDKGNALRAAWLAVGGKGDK